MINKLMTVLFLYFQPIKIVGGKYKMIVEGTLRQLHVNNVANQDEGIYTCSVQNKISSAKLYVARE